MKIGIVTDSTSDIPKNLVAELNINVLPVVIVIDGKDVLDDLEFSRQDYYNQLSHFKNHPTTAAPAPKSYSDLYKKLFNDGYDHILSIHASKKLSAIHNTAKMVATEFKNKITVIDSVSLSTGLGYQVIEAAKTIMNGSAIEKAIEKMNEVRSKVRVFAFIDTMTYVKKSGRVSWVTAGVGDLLKIKPIIEVADGVLKNFGQVRTSKKMIARMEQMIKEMDSIQNLTLLYTNTLATVKNIFEKIDVNLPEPPNFLEVTPAIGTHTGPNSIGFVVLQK
jgi:DegV family protein with EDD domain